MFEAGIGVYLVPTSACGRCWGLLGTYRCLRQALGVTWYLHLLVAGVGDYLVPTGV